VFDGGETIAGASVMREPFPEHPGPDDWRIRGMATRAHARGRGAGGLLLRMCVAHAAAASGASGGVLWCNARVGARRFYERAGMAVAGDVFEISGIGPHLLMWQALEAAGPHPAA
jgi:GNAT superfamily N-acetyltransferase